MGVLTRELMALYQAFSHGHADPLPPLPIQYADYALWQRGWMEAGEQARQLAYWQALLGGEDYALLGSCAPDMLPPLHSAIPGLFSIGVVTSGGGIVCNNAPLDNLGGGFDHFEA